MKNFLLLLSLLVSFSGCRYQSLDEYVNTHINPIKGIDASIQNYDDLKAIGDAIGESRIVMLGEQDHGDAPTFLAKTRLVKYLHEKKGFNVLAFESDIYGLTQGWEELSKQSPSIDSFIKKNIFSIWTRCDACADLLYTYIPQTYTTSQPLILSGFDSQLILAFSRKRLTKDLDSVLSTLKIPYTNTSNYRTIFLPALNTLLNGFKKVEDIHKDVFIQLKPALITIKKECLTKISNDNYWILILDNLIALNDQLSNHLKNITAAMDTRDTQMALNLEWLLKFRYPGEKIIVWAHNWHIAKYTDPISEQRHQAKSMGTYFTRKSEWDAQTYVLAFTSATGSAGRVTADTTYTIDFNAEEGLERLIKRKKLPYAFLNFKDSENTGLNQLEPFLMKGFSHIYSKESWNKVFDGIFYIEKMYPCTRIP